MWNITLATAIMASFNFYNDNSCLANCSGHGECTNGTCVCTVHYQGGDCEEYNNAYFIAFGTVFYLLCFIAIAQLTLCIRSEIQRSKTSSVSVACRITTQKTLYVMVILATFSRGLYFTIMKYIPHHWAANLLNMYYPFVLSCCTLCVCFWAEAFHIANKSYERPGSLSKSLVYFLAFNVCLYGMLVAQFIASEFVPNPKNLIMIVQCIFACLIIIEVILFLAYGVEVFFKVKGAFANASSSLDPRTLHMSRFGLIFHSILQILTAFFLLMTVTESKWKDNIHVPLSQRNSYVIVFRIVELGMVLWFPCVLWNCRSPEKLWVLNPKTILREQTDEECASHSRTPDQIERSEERSYLACRTRKEDQASTSMYQSTESCTSSGSGLEPECWICYDRDNPSLGPLITPCTCKGDVAFVHHECLRRWMLEVVESDDNPEAIKCKICKNQYKFQEPGRVHFYKGLSNRDMVLCLLAFFTLGGGPGAVYAVLQAYPSSTVNIVTIGVCVLIEMTCLRYLGYTITNAYNRAKIFSMKFLGRQSTSVIMEQEMSTSGAPEQPSGAKGGAENEISTQNGNGEEDHSGLDGGVEVQSNIHVRNEKNECASVPRNTEQCVVHSVEEQDTESIDEAVQSSPSK